MSNDTFRIDIKTNRGDRTGVFIRKENRDIEYRLDDFTVTIKPSVWNELVCAMGADDEKLYATDTVGEFVGWRVWKYDRGYLKSTYMATAWFPEDIMTGHVGFGNKQGGIYAFRDKGHALEMLIATNPPAFLGSIELWGDVYEHQNGFRGQYASIRTIDMASDEEAAKFLPKLRQQYSAGGQGMSFLPSSPYKIVPRFLFPLGFGMIALRALDGLSSAHDGVSWILPTMRECGFAALGAIIIPILIAMMFIKVKYGCWKWPVA
jgi:hypothetical protein